MQPEIQHETDYNVYEEVKKNQIYYNEENTKSS